MSEPMFRARIAALAAELRAAGYVVSHADDVIPRATAVLLAKNAAFRHERDGRRATTPAAARECRARASAAAALATELRKHGKAS